jgi:hypothetical protein
MTLTRILMMVYSTLGFWTVSFDRNSKYRRKQRFGNWLFPFSGEVGKTPTLLGPLERANLNHWTTHIRVILRPTVSLIFVSGPLWSR